jgi:hypothetical protein
MVILPTGQVLYSSYKSIVCLYTPDGSPDPVWLPSITSYPTSVRRGFTYALSGRQINGLTQGTYYGNDATNATNYPIVRLQSGSSVYYCRTSKFTTMGLQTGAAVHSCAFTVPTSMPLGAYTLTVIANGIASAGRSITVTTKQLKELKVELKEKVELIENLKPILDAKVKRSPDVDLKINEELEFVREIEERWLENVRAVAQGLDAINAELSRTFIGPKERPFVGIPEPLVEELEPRKISAAEAKLAQHKIAFADGRLGIMSKEAEEFDQVIHDLHRSGGEGVGAKRAVKKKAAPRRKKT